jgi:hypothetical protein
MTREERTERKVVTAMVAEDGAKKIKKFFKNPLTNARVYGII